MTTHLRALLLSLGLALGLAACGDDPAPTDGGDPACEKGSKDCACLEGDIQCRGDNLFCAAGTCREPTCTVGDADCACFANSTCSQVADGTWLVCDGGLCQAPTCPQGSVGCGCFAGGTCDAGLFCAASAGAPPVCQLPDCTVGDANCGCHPDRTCNAAADGSQLICDGVACVAPTCQVGAADCSCLPNYACDAGLACIDSICKPQTCQPGTLTCGCNPDGTCTGSLVCDDGTCQDPGCPQGGEGCGCFADFTCGSVDGGVLLCQGGKCTKQACEQGAVGCGCLATGECEANATCSGGVCIWAACIAGDQGCTCTSGGQCDAGLVCASNNVCVGNTGYADGPCFPNGTCNPGHRCDANTCVACQSGAVGCDCFANATCATGLMCLGGTCASEADQIKDVPAAPKCFSPCTEGLLKPDGTYVPCSSDGLMPGCVGGPAVAPNACVEGSCVASGQSPPSCTNEGDCPDWQTCIEGQCYSECAYDSDCDAAHKCHRKVCRLPCNATNDPCPKDYACQTIDGETGFCMLLTDPSGDGGGPTVGSFDLDVSVIELSNVSPTATFRVINAGPAGEDFTVRKLEHTFYEATGKHTFCRAADAGCLCDPLSATPVTVGDTQYTCIPDGSAPLPWLHLGDDEASPAVVNQLETFVDGATDDGPTAGVITLAEAGGATTSGGAKVARWEGTLEVLHPVLGARRVRLRYSQRPEGRWTGDMVTFANFGDTNLQAWIDDRGNDGKLTAVGNAFIKIWGDFRNGDFDLQELAAMFTAVEEGSWGFASTAAKCSGVAACYLYDNPQGYITLSNNLSTRPVPSGVVSLPVALNLRAIGTTMSGRIETSHSLHYPGDAAVTVELAADPSDPGACDPSQQDVCVVGVEQFSATVQVGGRYATTSADVDCAGAPAGFEHVATPWLVPKFLEGTDQNEDTGQNLRYECRNGVVPGGSGGASKAENLVISASNPIPDGRTLTRHLELVDGALVNDNTLVLLFREVFDGFAPGDAEGFASYGYMVLNKADADLSDADYASPSVNVATTSRLEAVECTSELVDPLLEGAALDATTAAKLATGLITGSVPSDVTSVLIGPAHAEKVHYLCEDTGLFDGGAQHVGSMSPVVACPPGSKVTYFTIQGAFADADGPLTDQEYIASRPCQAAGSCQGTLNLWVDNATHLVRVAPVYKCTDANAVYCDADLDRRAGKSFYAAETVPGAGERVVLLPLRVEVDNAFRYKTRFRSRFGKNIGFTPEPCVPGSDIVPYCYDADAIEQIRHRVDCAARVMVDYESDLDANTRSDLREELAWAFAYTVDDINEPVTSRRDGFEMLYAELLTMLGDESYTASFNARFDLAGSNLVSFEGSAFEPQGIDLAGAAGYEMYVLYQSVQYYQLSLDRFYRLGDVIWTSFALQDGFVTAETVASYFDRLIRASTHKSRAYSEIAKRYQAFNEPNLARGVIERAYAATYVEGVILNRMMNQVQAGDIKAQAFIRKLIEQAQLVYEASLQRMRTVYQEISDERTNFGLPPDFIPFPALDLGDPNAFEKILAFAKQKLTTAAIKEATAIASNKTYETDQAAFQSELAQIRNNFENQLSQICGTFVGDDGVVYPATPKYAYLSEATSLLGNPCGYVGNGGLHDAIAGLELSALDVDGVALGHRNTLREIDIEKERVEKQCAQTVKIADYQFDVAGQKINLQGQIQDAQDILQGVQTAQQHAGTIANLIKCSIIGGTSAGGDCPMAAKASAYYVATVATLKVAAKLAEERIKDKTVDIARLDAEAGRWTTLQGCEISRINSEAVVKQKALQLERHSLDALKAEYAIRLALSRVQKLRNDAKRLIAQQAETQQLLIDVEAAKNDPNVRIYRNDSIITADRTFDSAVREAYKATRVFEYYTSQSYAQKGELYLVRMVAHGDFSLEEYMADLEDAFVDFEETFGNPDQRVLLLSLRDDILRIPRAGGDGTPHSDSQRVQMMRDRLADPRLVDSSGYLTLPFSTSVSPLSPLTRNHKIDYIEAELVGSAIGDTVGRIYLRQRGTGVVRTLEGDFDYFGFPDRTAVIDTFFNGLRVFPPEIYRSRRLRDRPVANTHWELVLNQLDEAVNKDIDLQSLSDLRLYVFYTDFTEL